MFTAITKYINTDSNNNLRIKSFKVRVNSINAYCPARFLDSYRKLPECPGKFSPKNDLSRNSRNFYLYIEEYPGFPIQDLVSVNIDYINILNKYNLSRKLIYLNVKF